MNKEAMQIVCPSCGTKIPVSEAITAQLRAGIEQELEAKHRQALSATEERIRKEAEEGHMLRIKELEEAVTLKSRALEKAQNHELELRRKTRELEDRQQALDLEVARQVDEAKKSLEKDIAARAADEFQRKLGEKDLQLESMKRQIEDLKRRAEQGSQQLQGEAFEVELESILAEAFPDDRFEPVPKGMRGADLIHHVMSRAVKVGTIVWEAKRTKGWQDAWLPRLRENQRRVGAEGAVIVSEALPEDARPFACRDGVWISSPSVAVPVAMALRLHLQQLHTARNLAAGKGEKMEGLYDYVTSTAFKQRIQGLVEAFIGLRDEHEKEKRTIQRTWAAQEKLHDRVMGHTAGLYGDLSGIVGAGLPEVPALETAALPPPEERGE